MSLPNANFITNKLAVKERWLKLYRTVYNKFLKRDIVHVNDFKLMLKNINTRLATIEANVAAGDAACMGALSSSTAAITTAIAVHFHVAPQAPAGSLPTGPAIPPPVAPPVPPAPAPTTPPTEYVDIALQNKGAALLGMGPATAPLGDGAALEAQKATLTALSDVGA